MRGAGLLVFALLAVTMTAAIAGQGSVAFRIHVVEDTTIAIPDPICENAESTIANALEYEGSIFTIDSEDAVALDSCADLTFGDWNISAEGNVGLDVYFNTNETLSSGLKVALGNTSSWTGDYVELSDTADSPLWAQNLADGNTMQVWQRVAADTTAVGNQTYIYSVEITAIRSGTTLPE